MDSSKQGARGAGNKQQEQQIFHSLNARDLTKFFNVDRASILEFDLRATTLRNTLAEGK